MGIRAAFACAFLALITTWVHAEETGTKFVKADTRERFEQVASLVRAGMESDGRYRFVSRGDRLVVEYQLGLMEATFDRHPATAQMPEGDRVALFNAQERINGILTRNDAERLVCTNERPIGTNIPQRTCRTYANAREHQAISDDYKRQRQFVPCKAGKVCPLTK